MDERDFMEDDQATHLPRLVGLEIRRNICGYLVEHFGRSESCGNDPAIALDGFDEALCVCEGHALQRRDSGCRWHLRFLAAE